MESVAGNETTMKLNVIEICPDFQEWPESWRESAKDISYGRKIIEIFERFILEMMKKGYAEKTVKRHIDNLWLLGGELIREINMYDQDREKDPLTLIQENIGSDGGPYCRHIDSEYELNSFDATCRKLHKYLKSQGKGSISGK